MGIRDFINHALTFLIDFNNSDFKYSNINMDVNSAPPSPRHDSKPHPPPYHPPHPADHSPRPLKSILIRGVVFLAGICLVIQGLGFLGLMLGFRRLHQHGWPHHHRHGHEFNMDSVGMRDSRFGRPPRPGRLEQMTQDVDWDDEHEADWHHKLPVQRVYVYEDIHITFDNAPPKHDHPGSPGHLPHGPPHPRPTEEESPVAGENQGFSSETPEMD